MAPSSTKKETAGTFGTQVPNGPANEREEKMAAHYQKEVDSDSCCCVFLKSLTDTVKWIIELFSNIIRRWREKK